MLSQITAVVAFVVYYVLTKAAVVAFVVYYVLTKAAAPLLLLAH